MDTLWGQGKDAICGNKQYASIDEQAVHFIHHLTSLSDAQAMKTSGIQSGHFWLRRAPLKKFGGPAWLLKRRFLWCYFMHSRAERWKNLSMPPCVPSVALLLDR
jgi:hypothetical protein